MSENNTQPPSKALIIAAFAAIYLVWGSTYIAIVIAIRDIPPLLMAGFRFLTAGLLLYLFARWKKESNPSIRAIGKISFTGILMLFFGTGAVAWVEQYIASGLAAIIVATVPLWFVLLDKRHYKENFSNKGIIIGLLVGFAGVLFLFSDKKSVSLSGNGMVLTSILVLVAGTIAWAIGSLYSKYQPAAGSTTMKAAFQMLAAGLCSILAGLLSGEGNRFDAASVSTESLLALLYLISFGSLIGYMAYVWLLSVRSATLVGTYAYVNPVVAVFLGWLIASEPISARQLIALAIILAGVILVTMAKSGKRN